MKLIINYQCEFCQKVYKNKKYFKAHEANCSLNPIRKRCSSCYITSTDSLEFKDKNCSQYNRCILNNDFLQRIELHVNILAYTRRLKL